MPRNDKSVCAPLLGGRRTTGRLVVYPTPTPQALTHAGHGSLGGHDRAPPVRGEARGFSPARLLPAREPGYIPCMPPAAAAAPSGTGPPYHLIRQEFIWPISRVWSLMIDWASALSLGFAPLAISGLAMVIAPW